MKIEQLLSRTVFQIGLLLLSAIAVYVGSLSAPMVFDDENIAKVVQAPSPGGLRWLSSASFAWTIQLFGDNILWLRLGNVLLHALNVVVLFVFLRRVFRLVLLDGASPGETDARLTGFAFFGALLFALHPVAVYSVAYLVQRSTLMATLFVLLMLLAYLHGVVQHRSRWLWLAALCYFAAVYSKEHSVAAPGLALALTLLLRPPSRETWRLVAPFFLLASAVAVSVVLNLKGVIGEVYEPRAGGMLDQAQTLLQEVAPLAATGVADGTAVAASPAPSIHLLSIISQSLLFFKYLALWVLPNPAWMSADMREPLALSVFAWPHTAGLAGFLLYVATALYLLCRRGRRGLCGFAMLFPAVLFVTEFSTVRIQEAFVLYRSYLWMPGLFLLLPLLLGRVPGRWAFVALTLLALAFVPLTLNRIQSFSSPYALWDDAEKLVRGKQGVLGVERIYFNHGNELVRLKRYEEALEDFTVVIEAKSSMKHVYLPFALANRGTIYYLMGRYPEALLDYNQTLAINPNNGRAYYWRALVNRALGNQIAADYDLQESCMRGTGCQQPSPAGK